MPDDSGFRDETFFVLRLGAGTVFLTDPAEAVGLGSDLPSHRFVVRRASDLLALEFQFVNFGIEKGELVALGAGRSLIIVRFPPQNLAEALFTEPRRSWALR